MRVEVAEPPGRIVAGVRLRLLDRLEGELERAVAVVVDGRRRRFADQTPDGIVGGREPCELLFRPIVLTLPQRHVRGQERLGQTRRALVPHLAE